MNEWFWMGILYIKILSLREVKFSPKDPARNGRNQDLSWVCQSPKFKEANTAFFYLLLWSQHESSTLFVIKHFSYSQFFFSLRSATSAIYSKTAAPWIERPSPRIKISKPKPSLSLLECYQSLGSREQRERQGLWYWVSLDFNCYLAIDLLGDFRLLT